ncbi:MAG: hypothetical protein ACI915_004995 [Gammaproteobacteria bacterium]|jgi:hypothetical protein
MYSAVCKSCQEFLQIDQKKPGVLAGVVKKFYSFFRMCRKGSTAELGTKSGRNKINGLQMAQTLQPNSKKRLLRSKKKCQQLHHL